MSEFEVPEVTVGTKYQKYHEDGSTPWLDNNVTLQKQISENKWLRWDGVEGSAESHMNWMHEQAKSLMSDNRRDEYRTYGSKNGFEYYIHDELTAQGRGFGFFKLEGTLQLEPRDMVAAMMDYPQLAESDKTVVLMKRLKTYRQQKNNQPFVMAAYWCNAPCFPFYYRDGVDLSGYKKDDDGVVWQLAVSAKGNNFVSMPNALAATDRYWAYRLIPNGDGTTKMTLICQTEINGMIPKLFFNRLMCSVLIDYAATTEKAILKNKESGQHQKLLKYLQLEDV